MLDFFRAKFYWIDFTIGTLICIVVIVLYKIKRIEKLTWYLYWVGFILGLCWEVPMSIANEIGIYPFATFITPPPFPSPFSMIVIIIIHSFWDGGLFLVGYWLVNRICSEPTFKRLKASELGVLIIWGQLSELAVELASTFSGGWEYVGYWWNPVLFIFNGHNITLWPQIIWFIAPIVFYFIALKLKPKFSINEVKLEI